MGGPFGFGVGDVIAVAQLARAIRKRLSDSTDQLLAIRSEVAGLSVVLEDVEESMTERVLSEEETKKLQTTVKGCQDVLGELDALIKKFPALGSESRRWKDKPVQALQKLRWDQAEVAELRSRITSNVVTLDALNGSISRKQTQTSVTKISQHLEGVQLRQQHQKILDWLSPHDYSSEQSDCLARREDGTGTWLLESPEFGAWITGTRQTLFCPGIPGAGKTIMSSIVIDHLRSTFREANVGVAFIYCRYKVRMEQTPFNILSSLLRQLVQGHDMLSPEASNLFKAHRQNNTRLTLKELCVLLGIEASRYSRVFIVLDALDECSDTNGTRRGILSEIRTLQSKQAVCLAATSRLIPTVIQDFKDAMRLDIKASEADVRKCIQGQFHRLPSCVTRNVSLQQSIEREIVSAVDGMFLLAQLHLDSLVDKLTPRAVKTALSKLPKGSEALDVAYDEAMQRINNQKPGYRELADKALTWIIFSLRPLTVPELQHAMAVELDDPELDEDNLPDASEMIASCAGLVIVDEESQIIRLVHYTTQEYFERVWERRSVECHASIATICLAYLSFGDHAQVVAQIFEQYQGYRRPRAKTYHIFALWFGKYPLLKYSATYWAQHATGMSLESMKSKALEFLSSPSRLNVACELRSHLPIFPQPYTPSRVTALQFGVCYGSKELVEALLSTGLAADAQGDKGLTPLHSAIRRGDVSIFRLLLSRDDVDVNSTSDDNATPLLWAVTATCNTIVAAGHGTIVADLLAHPDIDVNHAKSKVDTALYMAALRGYGEIVRMLLAHPDIDVNAARSNPPLVGAASKGYVKIVRMLIAHPDINVNRARWGHYTPLYGGAVHGHIETVRMLLAHPNIDVNAARSNPPLVGAASKGYVKIVGMLIAHPDIKINAAYRDGFTALHIAARWGHDKTVNLLLTHRDIDINAVASQGFTPALSAMKSGHIPTCKLLLSQDHVVVHPPSHYPPSSDERLLLAVDRLWAMWREGRLPEFSKAEEEEYQNTNISSPSNLHP